MQLKGIPQGLGHVYNNCRFPAEIVAFGILFLPLPTNQWGEKLVVFECDSPCTGHKRWEVGMDVTWRMPLQVTLDDAGKK